MLSGHSVSGLLRWVRRRAPPARACFRAQSRTQGHGWSNEKWISKKAHPSKDKHDELEKKKKKKKKENSNNATNRERKNHDTNSAIYLQNSLFDTALAGALLFHFFCFDVFFFVVVWFCLTITAFKLCCDNPS